MRRAFALLLAGFLLTSLPSCNPGTQLCDEICSCLDNDCDRDGNAKGDDFDYEECVDDAEDLQRESDEEGCGAEYDEYVTCLLDNSKCDENDERFEIDANDCDNEAEDLADCCDGDCGFGF